MPDPGAAVPADSPPPSPTPPHAPQPGAFASRADPMKRTPRRAPQPGAFAGAAGPPAPTPPRAPIALVLVRALAIIAVVAGLALFARGLDVRALIAALRQAKPLPLIVAGALSFVQLAFKALGWREVLAPVVQLSPARAFRYTAAGAGISIITPARAGEGLRVWLLKRDYGVTVASSSSVAVAEKLVDGIAMLVVLAPLPWLMPELPHWIGRGIAGFSIVLGSALVVLWFFAPTVAEVPVHPVVPVAPVPPVREKWWQGLQAGLSFMRRPRHAGRALAAMIASWLTDLVEVALVVYALGIPVPFAAGLLILLTINMAIAVPAMPGHIGTMEIGALVALELLHVPREQGLSFALLYHAVQVVPLLVVSVLGGRWLVAGRGGGGPSASQAS